MPVLNRLVVILSTLLVATVASLPLAAADFTPGDLVVYRTGTGAAALSSSGTPISIDEYTPSGTLVQSIALPTTASGTNNEIVADGTASSEGQLTLSSDQHEIVVTGYEAAVGTGSLTSSTSTAVPRVVGIINAHGAVDTSTALTDAASGNNPRSATSDGAGNIWFTGAAGGVRYATDGATTSTDLTTGTNYSQVQIFFNQLYVSSAKTGFIATIGSGLPESGSPTQTSLTLPGLTAPNGYVVLQLGSGPSPGPDTIYVADNLLTIDKYSYNLTTSAWVAEGTYSLAGVTGLTATVSSGVATLYATSTTGISSVTDLAGAGATATGSLATIVSLPTNEGFRGIGLTPTLPTPVISSALTASATVGTAFSYQITASNAPTTFGATPLPTWLTLSSTGLLSGTPTGVESDSITISAANSGGTGTATLALTVNASTVPSISSATTGSGTYGTAYSYQIVASNSPTSFNATGLPAGVTVSTSTGLISGTPTATGPFTVSLSATNGSGTGTATLTLTIASVPPVISSATTASAQVGTAFSYQIAASPTPTSYNATGLPGGLTISTTTGLISGTPTTVGTASIGLSATYAGGTGTATLHLTVNPPSPVIFSAPYVVSPVGTAVVIPILASNLPTSYAATGLPTGLTLNATTGVISGTPTAVGITTVMVTATNAGGASAPQALVLNITAIVPVISSALTASAQVGTAFSYQLTASNAPTAYGATGLPAGVTISATTGLISGTPTASGVSSVTVSATNAQGTGSATLVLTVAAASSATAGTATAGSTPAPAASSSSSHSCGLGGGIALLLAAGLGLRRRRSSAA